ncbi:hypothetical protein D1816_09475 [Aquimarina sp. AD10]|uniref:hypothetical protein n=1 Tax=Aquimarina sp. AD10 TaxID=1714849 RepID=UPI000E4FF156|nr:hypothetical protein [Aquimarina sp. AD10]AXT60570.1 hypothetical protein D1816_09475 [Aquimarina sp. AD10]RKN01662.1 hypothetical protein D7033_03340 [Aquimarina sp. AD10]
MRPSLISLFPKTTRTLIEPILHSSGLFFFHDIKSIHEWRPFLLGIKKHYKDLKEESDHGRLANYAVSLNGTFIKIQPTLGNPDEEESPIISGIQTLDSQNNSASLSVLGSLKRIPNPWSVVDSFLVRSSDTTISSGTTISSDTAAIEIGISEQSYGGRTAVIAAIMTHMFGGEIYNIYGRREELAVNYHKFYIGSGIGGALLLASHQLESVKVKKGTIIDPRTFTPIPTAISAQYQAIKLFLNKNELLSKNQKEKILTGVEDRTKELITLLYRDEINVANALKENFGKTIEFLLTEGNELNKPEMKTFETQGETKLKADGAEFSDDEDEERIEKNRKKRRNSLKDKDVRTGEKGKNKTRNRSGSSS